jgi:hypothetical protein
MISLRSRSPRARHAQHPGLALAYGLDDGLYGTQLEGELRLQVAAAKAPEERSARAETSVEIELDQTARRSRSRHGSGRFADVRIAHEHSVSEHLRDQGARAGIAVAS